MIKEIEKFKRNIGDILRMGIEVETELEFFYI